MINDGIHKSSVHAAVADLSPGITMMKVIAFLPLLWIYNNMCSFICNSSWYGIACLQNFSRDIKTSTFIAVLTINSKEMGQNKCQLIYEWILAHTLNGILFN